jgi:hypothetical protein
VQTILPMLNEYLATEGRDSVPPEQEDRDLARLWNHATGAWAGPGLGDAVQVFVARGASAVPGVTSPCRSPDASGRPVAWTALSVGASLNLAMPLRQRRQGEPCWGDPIA